MTVRIAAAPCSYGVFEITVDGRPDLPTGEALASEMAGAGYEGTELGPPGFFGDGGRVAELLGTHGLLLAGSFLPFTLADDAAFGAELAALPTTLTILREGSVGGELPVILLSDAFNVPVRMHFAGAIEQHPEAWLDTRGFATLVANAHRVAETCRDAGFAVSLHYHAGTYVETPREIARFVEQMDPALLGLCFDTGHSAFGGGDPLALLAEYGELVNHVHIKDVNRTLLADVLRRGAGLKAAWGEGVFCPLGTGDAQVDACLKALRDRGYAGWLVCEQDTVLSDAFPFSRTVEDGRRNIEFLRERVW
jgi:inosose dehydratase